MMAKAWSVAFLASVALAAPGSLAQSALEPNYANVDTERWRCRLCPFDDASERKGQWSVGAIGVRDSQPRFGRDNGLDEAGVHADVHASYRQTTEQGRSLEFTAADLGLDSRHARLRIRDLRRVDFDLEYREIPRNVSADGRTPYRGAAALALPGDWEAAFSVGGMTALAASSRPFRHATRRASTVVGIRIRLTDHWWTEAGYRQETKTGREETHADLLYRATALPRKTDYRTEEFSASVGFDTRPLVVVATLRRAGFSNMHLAVEWENPWAPRVPAGGRKAAAPSSDADTLTLVARSTLGERTSTHATLSWTSLAQDDAFLPYSTNPALTVDPLPADSLDGRVRLFAGTMGFVSRLTDRVTITALHRQRERRNRSPTFEFTPALGDLFSLGRVQNHTYGFDKGTTQLRVRYRVAPSTRVSAGVDANRTSRNGLEIARNEERRKWIAFSVDGPAGWRFEVEAADADRDASDFESITPNNPLTRRFYQAARSQTSWKARVGYAMTEVGVTAGIQADYRSTTYPDSDLGLSDDESRSVGGDISFAPTAHVVVVAYHSAEEMASRTAGSDRSPWVYTTRDNVRTTGVSAALHGLANDRLDLEIEYVRSDGSGHYATHRNGDDLPFPILASDRWFADLRLRYHWRAGTDVLLRYHYEDYRSADWAFVGIEDIPNVLTTGHRAPVYGNSLVSVSVETRW